MTRIRFIAFFMGAVLANSFEAVLLSQEKPAEVPAQPSVTQQPAVTEQPAFPSFDIPENADLSQLSSIIERAKNSKPRIPAQYRAMQTAIRDAARKSLSLLAGKEDTAEYKQAELETIAATVSLMAYLDADAKQKTLEQVHKFLRSRAQLSMSDVQTGILAAAMIELQPNKKPARNTYELLDELLTNDKREEMQSLRINLQAAIRRLNLLGKKLPLVAVAMDGKTIEIDDYAGKFVIVDFFATWCEPCLSEIPILKKYLQKYGSQGLEVIGISLDSDAEALNAYLKSAALPWSIIHDNDENPLNRLQMEFGVSQLPTVLLLNKEGTVVSLEARGSELDRLMQMLFARPTPAAPLKSNEKSEAASSPQPVSPEATSPQTDKDIRPDGN